MNSSREDWIPILNEAAKEARKSVRAVLNRKPRVGTSDLKRLLDDESEKAIEGVFKRRGASVNIISEEGEAVIGRGGTFIIIDPVDGTTNLAKGIPFAATSMAVSESQRFDDEVAALVMNLYSGKTYWAELSRGAWSGRRRLKPAGPKPIGEALMSLDISKGALQRPVGGIIARSRHIRQLGSSALALCLVSSGVLDAHVDLRGILRATDIAAGLFILKEAGGAYSIDGVPGGDMELTRESKIELIAASGQGVLKDIRSFMG
jgi:myo-inositol-1(or 4)-monophosphatase